MRQMTEAALCQRGAELAHLLALPGALPRKHSVKGNSSLVRVGREGRNR